MAAAGHQAWNTHLAPHPVEGEESESMPTPAVAVMKPPSWNPFLMIFVSTPVWGFGIERLDIYIAYNYVIFVCRKRNRWAMHVYFHFPFFL